MIKHKKGTSSEAFLFLCFVAATSFCIHALENDNNLHVPLRILRCPKSGFCQNEKKQKLLNHCIVKSLMVGLLSFL
jgi:hypothetical protein